MADSGADYNDREFSMRVIDPHHRHPALRWPNAFDWCGFCIALGLRLFEVCTLSEATSMRDRVDMSHSLQKPSYYTR